MADKPRVVIAMPRYSGTAHFEAVKAMLCWPTRGACDVVENITPSYSLINQCFNLAWCNALNLRNEGIATHFAMIHSDIAPEPGWLDILVGELLRLDADVVSAVVPIKNSKGLTSTAVQAHGEILGLPLPRRLTMKEVFDLPETFGADDVQGVPLLNTGLWVCDLTRPCFKDLIWFESLEEIRQGNDGKLYPMTVSEDWLFSWRLHHRGAKLFATRKVKLLHHGERTFPNQHVWGAWQTDEIYQQAINELAKSEQKDLEPCSA